MCSTRNRVPPIQWRIMAATLKLWVQYPTQSITTLMAVICADFIVIGWTKQELQHIMWWQMYTWPKGGAMEFIQDCHIHLFRLEASLNAQILGQIGQGMCKVEQLLYSWRDTELCLPLTATPSDEKLQFSLSVIVNVLTTDLTRFEMYWLLLLGAGMHNRKHDISCCQQVALQPFLNIPL